MERAEGVLTEAVERGRAAGLRLVAADAAVSLTDLRFHRPAHTGVGRKDVLPIRYDPTAPFHERYVIDRPVEGDLRTRSILNAIRLTDALGYDMDTVEFAVRGGELYAIDFLNPAPDFDSFSIKEANFGWVLEKMSALVIAYATGEATPPWQGEHRWWRHVR